MKKRILCWSSLVLSVVLLACSHSDDVTVATPYPILFVTQVPPETDDGTRLSAFANHRAGVDLSPRGGDLMLRGVDGTLRNLTREAGFGSDGWQGANSIAVREPAVHWGGDKAVFSMVVGAPVVAGQAQESAWQLYEVRGFGIGEKASITRIANQPERYNNLSPVYASDDRILFTSDRPHNGQAHLYPALDEYEAMPTTSGLWALEPTTGTLTLLSHAPSGAFNPLVDSFGRIIFTRWDHLQQDRLAERDRNAQGNGVAIPLGPSTTLVNIRKRASSTAAQSGFRSRAPAAKALTGASAPSAAISLPPGKSTRMEPARKPSTTWGNMNWPLAF